MPNQPPTLSKLLEPPLPFPTFKMEKKVSRSNEIKCKPTKNLGPQLKHHLSM